MIKIRKLVYILITFCLLSSHETKTMAQQQIFNKKQLVTDGRVWDIAFADLNTDGCTDIIIANWFKPPTIYYDNGKGEFISTNSLPCSEIEEGLYRGHSVGVADFDNNGNSDIFYVFNGRNNQVYLGDNGEYLKSDTLLTNQSDGLYISLGDVDTDNDIDAIVSNYQQPTVLWLNDGNGNFKTSNTDFGFNAYNCELGDINNDDYLDVICSINGDVAIWINEGNNNYKLNTQTIAYNKGYGRIKLADMDNDKDLDIVLANRVTGGSIWINNGSGLYSEEVSNLSKSSVLSVGDLDADGQLDLILGNAIWLNNGNGMYLNNGILEVDGIILGLWLNDIDNDNDLDLFYSTTNVEKGLELMLNTLSKR